MSSVMKVFLTVILLACAENEAARILAVMPTASISHQIVFRSLFQELAKRGHSMTVVTTDPAFEKGKKPPNLTEIDLHDISYDIWKDVIYEKANPNTKDQVAQFTVVLDLLNILTEKQIKSREFQEILKNPEDYYDLIFIEACFKPYLALSHIFKAPVIMLSSMGAVLDNYHIVGAPTHPTLSPAFFRQKIYNLTFWEKLDEFYTHYRMTCLIENHQYSEHQVLKKIFGSNVPSISKLKNNVHMLFLNSHPILNHNQPVPPTVLQLMGIYQKTEKGLPGDLKSYLDKSSDGVIYMSFGTNTDPSLLSSEKIQIFVKVFKTLPFSILWKWNRDDFPCNATNIKFGKWFPQFDVLRHPNVKLFITQGGLQSTEESINAGVPLIGIPMLADQWYNTEKYKYFNVGTYLDFDSLDENTLRSNIITIITNEYYRKNLEKLRLQITDQSQTPLERAVWWTEYVIRHKGAKHLRSPYANISWWDYLELDFVLKLLALLTSSAISCVMVLFSLFKFLSFIFKGNNKLKKK